MTEILTINNLTKIYNSIKSDIIVGNFGISLFFNSLYTLIINYFAFFFIGELAAQATQRGSLGLKSLMESFPFYLVTNGFNQLHYSLFAAIIILVFSLVMYGAGLLIFQKRDLL